MKRIDERYKMDFKPKAYIESIVSGKNFRFTVLTDKLIRMEYDPDGHFEDRATQVVVDRNFHIPDYEVVDTDTSLEIITKSLHLFYDKQAFSRHGLRIEIKGKYSKYGNIWRYSDKTPNLLGTTRTLDQADGEVPLENGLLSKNGYAVLDDSKSLIIAEDGWVDPRKNNIIDLYFFGYGRDYLLCLKEFYHLCGPQPLLPKYVFGNWWSRYYRYTEAEYKELMMRFKEEQIPFTVAVLDMDWHITKVDSKYGSGWTAYTWDKECFPNPPKFMEWLHDEGLRVTLNVHPADGVKPYEEVYEEMCKALGDKPSFKDGISFDMTDPEFVEAYFKYLHHPQEDDGVDFWWIDWQSGGVTRVEGLDPLWLLNHFHYLDSGRNGNRPLTFSRYAGPGSHRYPIGFSGDTIVSWESLEFQPYFTSTASNIGYGWWSHDIGGHMNGIKNDELSVRWVQLGVFSPINRLHSSDNPFDGKEPWRYGMKEQEIIKDFLQLRHRLIPYIYSMGKKCVADGMPLIQPMYYLHPWNEEAYEVKNEYYFGSELIVYPITRPINAQVERAKVKVWLPEGEWIDFFDGMVYRGGRYINVYRQLSEMPVFGKTGAIVPMFGQEAISNNIDNPVHLEWKVFAGSKGDFHLYEDDDCALADDETAWVDTCVTIDSEEGTICIAAVKGNAGVVPKKRSHTIQIMGTGENRCVAFIGNASLEISVTVIREENSIVVKLEEIDVTSDILLKFEKPLYAGNQSVERKIEAFLNQAQIKFDLKKRIFDCVLSGKANDMIIAELYSYQLDADLFGVLCEYLCV